MRERGERGGERGPRSLFCREREGGVRGEGGGSGERERVRENMRERERESAPAQAPVLLRVILDPAPSRAI